MEPRRIILNLANSKVGEAMISLDEKHISKFKETVATDRNKPLTREEMKAFLDDFDDADTKIHTLLMEMALFYSSIIRMKELMDEYALNEITSKVFPKQLQAFKALLKLVETTGNYYKGEKGNQAGMDTPNS